ncbi:siderophore-interacting protein [Nitratireductor thuwali]|uniref:Vibriobactin utilization protein ViuB n=1 Tax=Nitratireductor thuwali TaxID=2267699 RepID=A0ABY5MKV0_9HYPH|nr:Vibriobactin utilization protein ViuB [Nitratireductor thuwali]
MKTASAVVTLTNPVSVLEALRTHLAEHELVVEFDGQVASANLPSGHATMRIEASMLELEVRAASESGLEDVASFLASHVLEFAHPETPVIRWSGFQPSGTFADFREMKVVGVTELTPHMRRITLAGTDLRRFATDENLHVRLFFPAPGQPPVWPTRGEDGLERHIEPARQPAVRKYTIRRIDLVTGTVDIDFLLHRDPGTGSDWAKNAKEGDMIGMAGPGGRGAQPADWLLLVGDETALPAIARILEGLAPGTEGMALIEVESEADKLPLTHPRGFEIRWLHRAACAEGLAAAVSRIRVPTHRKHFCWAGAEFETIQTIRRYWKEECGVAKWNQLAVPYWRRGRPEGE